MSIAGWDHFKVSSQPNSPSLVEAMRTLYGSNLPQELSSDTKIAFDQLAVEEALFTTITNKKSKGKGKVPPSICSNVFAPGPDHITWHYLKSILADNIYVSGIISLANSCITLRHWPRHFKESISVIIPKPSKPAYNTPKVF